MLILNCNSICWFPVLLHHGNRVTQSACKANFLILPHKQTWLWLIAGVVRYLVMTHCELGRNRILRESKLPNAELFETWVSSFQSTHTVQLSENVKTFTCMDGTHGQLRQWHRVPVHFWMQSKVKVHIPASQSGLDPSAAQAWSVFQCESLGRRSWGLSLSPWHHLLAPWERATVRVPLHPHPPHPLSCPTGCYLGYWAPQCRWNDRRRPQMLEGSGFSQRRSQADHLPASYPIRLHNRQFWRFVECEKDSEIL